MKDRIGVFNQYRYQPHLYHGQYTNGKMRSYPTEERESGHMCPVPLLAPYIPSLHSGLDSHSGAYVFRGNVYQPNKK